MSRFLASMASERSSARGTPEGMCIGDRFTKDVAFTEESIRQFATYVGDSNPLHHDRAAAVAAKCRAGSVGAVAATSARRRPRPHRMGSDRYRGYAEAERLDCHRQ